MVPRQGKISGGDAYSASRNRDRARDSTALRGTPCAFFGSVLTSRGFMPQSPEPVCSFCDLMRGSAEVSMCYEDADVVAFMDVQPVNAGHVLVVPRKHYEGLDDIPHQLAMHLFEVAMELAPVVKQVAGAD